MRALVTGCAGFVGSHLTESLLSDGHDVVGVDCFNDNYARQQKLDNLRAGQDWDAFQFVPIDLARGDLDDLIAEVDTVFHLAAEPGVRTSWGARFETYVRNNVSATHHVLEALARHPGRRLVYASSSSIYGQAEKMPTREDTLPAPYSPYGVTKLTAEHLCAVYHANHGVETVTLRYFTVYGPRQRPDMAFNRFCRAVLTGDPVVLFGDGNQSRDFTYVADTVAATRAAANRSVAAGGVYNIGGGAQVTVNDVLETLEDLAGRPVPLTRARRESGDVRHTGADASRARAELRFCPQWSVRDGLEAELRWMQQLLAAV